MREVPGIRLTEAVVLGKTVPSNYNVVATDAPLDGLVLGNVYKDPAALKARMIWAAWARAEDGDAVFLGHHGTRQKAALEVAKKSVVLRDEDEAHGIVEVMEESTILAVEHAQQQRDDWGDDSHLAMELNSKHILDEPTEELVNRLSSLRQELSDVLNGKGLWKLELAHVERLAYDTHMIDLELERRERQAKITRSAKKVELMRESDQPVFCSECRLHFMLHPGLGDPEAENEDEDCCGQYRHMLRLMPSMPPDFSSWGTWREVYGRDVVRSQRVEQAVDAIMTIQAQQDLVRPTDGALIRSIHQHLTSPWRPTPGVMHEMLNAVRELEKQALENEKSRPASMVVTVQDDVLERLAKLEGQHKVLKARTTMLLAGVVTALHEDETSMLRLLKQTFAMGPDDITDEEANQS